MGAWADQATHWPAQTCSDLLFLPPSPLVEARPAGLQIAMDVEQHGATFSVQALGLLERGSYFVRSRDRNADRAQAFGDLGIVAGHLGHLEHLACGWIPTWVGGHVAIVEEDGRDRHTGADGGFNVQTGHAEGAVAHE